MHERVGEGVKERVVGVQGEGVREKGDENER